MPPRLATLGSLLRSARQSLTATPLYRVSRSAVLLDGECSEAFDVQQGVAQGCSLSPILFSVFINGLLKEVEQAGLGVELSDGSTIGGMLFADDFVGVSNSEEELQRLINVAHAYCCKWRLKANVRWLIRAIHYNFAILPLTTSIVLPLPSCFHFHNASTSIVAIIPLSRPSGCLVQVM